jgi:ABC-2 type transport system permease protein
MKRFMTFVKKEFYHVLRDRTTLLILFGMPVVQMLIFGFALTNEVENSKVVLFDQAQDEASRQLIGKIEASQYFQIERSVMSLKEIEASFKAGKIKVAVVIPAGFNATLLHQNKAQLQVIADASDPNYATTMVNYLSAIVLAYQQQLNGNLQIPYQIVAETKMIYNPQMKSVHNFVPGVMALILMLVCVMMTAVSIVREKENGTMEVLLVSPFNPMVIIISKAIPYLFLSLLNVTTILLLSVFVLDLPISGSVLLLYAESTLFIITCLTLGIFISVKTDSQQAAMLISLMGMLLPTIMFSGFMFPIENMPKPLQIISNIVPAKWYFLIVKSIMIKGLGLGAIWKETLILLGMTLILFVLSIRNFKIRLA